MEKYVRLGEINCDQEKEHKKLSINNSEEIVEQKKNQTLEATRHRSVTRKIESTDSDQMRRNHCT